MESKFIFINFSGFNNWNTNIAGTGTSYNDQEAVTVTTDITLYGQWTATTLTISQDLIGSEGNYIDDGANGNGSVSYSVGEPIIFTINNQITQGFQQPNDVNNSAMVLNDIADKIFNKIPGNNFESTNSNTLSNNLEVKIYPNPSSGSQIKIEASGFNSNKYNYTVEIFDISSKVVDQFEIESQSHNLFFEINFSKTLNDGVYFLKVSKGNNQLIEKFIIQ